MRCKVAARRLELYVRDTRPICGWDSSLLAPMSELNAEILETMFDAAPLAEAAGNAAGLQWRWRALRAPARLRLAHCPYLLLDAGFAAAHTRPDLRPAVVHAPPPLPPPPHRPGPP